jgi:hypothetical protein
MSRRDLTHADRIALLEKMKNQPPNASHRQLAEIIGVLRSTITYVLHRQEKLRGEWSLCHGQQRTSQNQKHDCKDVDDEEALNQWFSFVTGRCVHVSGPTLKNKSEEFQSNRWLVVSMDMQVWDKIQEAHGKKDSPDAVSAEQWKSIKLPNLLQKFWKDDICSASETDLFYCAMPDSSLNYKHVTCLQTCLASHK